MRASELLTLSIGGAARCHSSMPRLTCSRHKNSRVRSCAGGDAPALLGQGGWQLEPLDSALPARPTL